MSNPIDLSNRIKGVLNKLHTLAVDSVGYQFLVLDIYNLVNQEIKADREACAQIVENTHHKYHSDARHYRLSEVQETMKEILYQIRQRGE